MIWFKRTSLSIDCCWTTDEIKAFCLPLLYARLGAGPEWVGQSDVYVNQAYRVWREIFTNLNSPPTLITYAVSYLAN